MVPHLNPLLATIQFLTRVPVTVPEPVPLRRATPWFAVVGAGIGASAGLVAIVTGAWLTPTVAAALAVTAGLLITGAFHEDGLADIADALGGGAEPQQRLEILSDSRHGTYGVAALCMAIVIRVVALGSMGDGVVMFVGLVAGHSLARAIAIAAALVVQPAAPTGLGADAASGISRAGAVALAGSTTAIGLVVSGWWFLVLAVAGVAGGAIVSWLSIRKIGGMVGDSLGAIEQLVECITVVVVSGLAASHQLWWR